MSVLSEPLGAERVAAFERSDTVLIALVSTSVAALHLSAAQSHWSQSRLYGILFLVLAVTQAAWGLILTRRRTEARRWLTAGLVLNAGVIIVFLCSRTVGLPVGPDLGHPEAVGIPDACATLAEMVLLLIGGLSLRRRGAALPEWTYALGLLMAFASLIIFGSLAHVS